MTTTSEDSVVRKIVFLFKKLLLKQMKFKVRKRGHQMYKRHLSKHFKDDEWIDISVYAFQLLNCRMCNKISKAYLSSSRYCIRCIENKKKSIATAETSWSLWDNVSFTR